MSAKTTYRFYVFKVKYLKKYKKKLVEKFSLTLDTDTALLGYLATKLTIMNFFS